MPLPPPDAPDIVKVIQDTTDQFMKDPQKVLLKAQESHCKDGNTDTYGSVLFY